jgi:hypothetical protein
MAARLALIVASSCPRLIKFFRTPLAELPSAFPLFTTPNRCSDTGIHSYSHGREVAGLKDRPDKRSQGFRVLVISICDSGAGILTDAIFVASQFREHLALMCQEGGSSLRLLDDCVCTL